MERMDLPRFMYFTVRTSFPPQTDRHFKKAILPFLSHPGYLRKKPHVLAKLEAGFLDRLWLRGNERHGLAAVRNQRGVAVKRLALVQVHRVQLVEHVHDFALDNVFDRGAHQLGHGVVADAEQTDHGAGKQEVAAENQLLAVDQRGDGAAGDERRAGGGRTRRVWRRRSRSGSRVGRG